MGYNVTNCLEDNMLSLTYRIALKARQGYQLLTRYRVPGVRGLIVQNDHVVLVKHRAGVRPWGLPGGGVGPREPLDVAVRRELQEETGCTVRVKALLGIFPGFFLGKPTSLTVFVCVPLTPLQPPSHDIEIATARYAPLRSLPVDTDMETRWCIAAYVCGETGIVKNLPIKER